MKYIILMLLNITLEAKPVAISIESAVVETAPKAKGDDELPPEVQQFVVQCMDDEDNKYQNVEVALLKEKPEAKFRDSKLEILSGIIWNTDQARAHRLAKLIHDEKLRKQILGHYDALESLPQAPSVKEN